MNTESLDAQIRRRARNELERVLRKDFAALVGKWEHLLGGAYVTVAPDAIWSEKRGEKTTLQWLLAPLERHLFDLHAPGHEQAAIDDFLAKFDSLQGQIDDLRQGFE